MITSVSDTRRWRLGEPLGCPHTACESWTSLFESRQREQCGADLDLTLFWETFNGSVMRGLAEMERCWKVLKYVATKCV